MEMSLLAELQDRMEVVFARLYADGSTDEVEDFVELMEILAKNHSDPEVWALVGDWAGKKA